MECTRSRHLSIMQADISSAIWKLICMNAIIWSQWTFCGPSSGMTRHMIKLHFRVSLKVTISSVKYMLIIRCCYHYFGISSSLPSHSTHLILPTSKQQLRKSKLWNRCQITHWHGQGPKPEPWKDYNLNQTLLLEWQYMQVLCLLS